LIGGSFNSNCRLCGRAKVRRAASDYLKVYSMPSDAQDKASFSVSLHAPLAPTHPVHQLIGQVASEWALFEHTLDRTIWSLLGVPNDLGACLTAQIIGATPRFNAIIALATRKKIKNDIVKQVLDLRNRSYDIQEQRNRIIHDPWFMALGLSPQVAQFKSPKKEPVFGMADIDQSNIKKLIAGIVSRRTNAEELSTILLQPPS
jgi:hypothetical protein